MNVLSLNTNHQYTLSGIGPQIWVRYVSFLKIFRSEGLGYTLAQAARMQKFEYRTPRYPVDLPVLLTLQNATIPGRCQEISREGMKVELRDPVTPDTCGTVSVSYKELSLELPVCVARAGAGLGGLRFILESEKDRSAVERLVSLLASAAGHPGPILVR